jgi:hypothetical protein
MSLEPEAHRRGEFECKAGMRLAKQVADVLRKRDSTMLLLLLEDLVVALLWITTSYKWARRVPPGRKKIDEDGVCSPSWPWVSMSCHGIKYGLHNKILQKGDDPIRCLFVASDTKLNQSFPTLILEASTQIKSPHALYREVIAWHY